MMRLSACSRRILHGAIDRPSVPVGLHGVEDWGTPNVIGGHRVQGNVHRRHWAGYVSAGSRSLDNAVGA